MDEYLDPINQLYKENLTKFGVNSKSVGWKDSESQILRFEVLNKIIEDPNLEFSVNDYGSGYGAHLTHLNASGYKVNSYNAYDINLEMLEKLVEVHKSSSECAIQTLHSAELSTYADFSFVSGTFNVMPNDDTAKWEGAIKERLQQLKKYSKKGFAFNLLSTYVDWHADGLFYADPLFWFDYCKNEISKNVALYHDYDLYEWTILCRFNEDKLDS